MPSPDALPPRDGDALNVIIETPQGSRNKFAYDKEVGLFRISHVLPAGSSFPFDFGFIPSTLAEDGDALDVLLLMDAPAFPGCLVAARLVGVIEAEQEEGDERLRNDRLIAVATSSHRYQQVTRLDGLSDQLLDEIEHFFESYNRAGGRAFEPIGRHGPERAWALVEEAIQRFQG